MRKIINNIALTLAIYGFAVWVLVALIALITPQYLSSPFVHISRWPRTDTAGMYSFAISAISFFIYRSTRHGKSLG